jgi:hypothetical protein
MFLSWSFFTLCLYSDPFNPNDSPLFAKLLEFPCSLMVRAKILFKAPGALRDHKMPLLPGVQHDSSNLRLKSRTAGYPFRIVNFYQALPQTGPLRGIDKAFEH